ncbi:MAG: hypothetical protein O6945_07225 [Gammaproteobacteria bacterium]|nr:hypothetical protein [Gammaproteobacteria bacterium]
MTLPFGIISFSAHTNTRTTAITSFQFFHHNFIGGKTTALSSLLDSLDAGIQIFHGSPVLLADSEKRAAEQREIYLRLVAEDTQMVQ